MKLLVDMNLSQRRVQVLERNQFQAVHWSNVGDPSRSRHRHNNIRR